MRIIPAMKNNNNTTRRVGQDEKRWIL